MGLIVANSRKAVKPNLLDVARPVQADFDAPITPEALLQLAADSNQTPLDKGAPLNPRTRQFSAEEFWVQNDIQLSRWDQMYPFQLLVLRASAASDGGTTFRIEPGWQFTLPLPPEAMSISTPSAVTTTVTLGGIVEEHNGAPLRFISVRGTTGMLAGRGSARQQVGFDLASTIAGGTVAALQRAQGDLNDTLASLNGTATTNPNVHSLDDFLKDETETGASAVVAKSTGYYQSRKLVRFWEAYLAIKKTKAGRNLCLAFANWKDQAVYLVTPTAMEISRQPGFEYFYNLSFKAWRRVNPETGSFVAVLGLPIRRSPNALARALNTLRDARRTVQSLSKVAAAVVGDVDHLIFEPLRETVLFAKDIMGLGLSIAELPDAVTKRTQEFWVEFQGQARSLDAASNEVIDKVKAQLRAGSSSANETRDIQAPGARSLAVGTGQGRRGVALATHPAAAPFRDPKAHIDLMEKTDVSSMKLPPALLQQIATEQNRVRQFRRADFETRRDSVRLAADKLAIALGAGNTTFEETYGITVAAMKSEPTQADWDTLYALNAAAMVMDSFAATGDAEPSSRETKLEVMAGLARRSGIAFTVPASKFAVPFPYGATLESLANQYLGSPDRWHEIAVLNGLREPYIDEVGFELVLQVNGAANQVVVPDPGDYVFVGQTCYVESRAARRTRRTIQGIRKVGTNLVLTLNGDADLSSYKTVDSAKFCAFRPDTINSQQLIYIPSDAEPADDNAITKSIPGVAEFDPMTAVGGVDLLLDSNNDLIITPDGDCRLAIGLTNIIQSVRVALSVRRGTLLHHDDYGIPLNVGVSTAEFDANQVLGAVRRMLSGDGTFSRVDAVKVSKNAGVAKIDVAVTVAGTTQPVPVSYEVRGDFQTA